MAVHLDVCGRAACHLATQRTTARRSGHLVRRVEYLCPKLRASTADVQGHSEDHNPVDRALQQAEAAFQEAQESLSDVTSLPSARLPYKMPPLLKRLLKAALLLGAVAAIIASHAHSPAARWALAALTASYIGVSGYYKQRLDTSGAIAAAVVGTTVQASSLRCAAVLMAFFFSSAKMTVFKEHLKTGAEDFKKGGQRDWRQVACNGMIPSILALTASAAWGGSADFPLQLSSQQGRQASAALAGFLGYFACCCGDTWASELGQLSEQQPRLITTLRPVRKGTNGGVTLAGLGASTAGGLFVGLVFYAAVLVCPSVVGDTALRDAALQQWLLIPAGMLAGLVGSLIDSVFGATLQYTGYNRTSEKIVHTYRSDMFHISGIPLLSNNMVNLVSASLTAFLTSRMLMALL